MKVKKIYRILMWVNKRVARGRLKGNLERIETVDVIVVNNLETAKHEYKKALNRLTTWYYSQYSGKCQLFEPHIFDDGTLAAWPDNEKYIEQEAREE